MRPEEAGILLVVLAIWLGAILLFYSRFLLLSLWRLFPHHRWKKFSGVEPFTPYYVEQVERVEKVEREEEVERRVSREVYSSREVHLTEVCASLISPSPSVFST